MIHPLDTFRFCPKCGSDKFDINSNISKKCKNCEFEYYKNPSIGVGALIFDSMNRLLVIRRAKEPGKGTLGLPGGFVDIGETIEEAVVREAKEEINVDITVEKYITSLPNTYIYSGMDAKPLDFFFICKAKNFEKITIDKTELEEVLFIRRDEIVPNEFGLESNKKLIKILIKNNIWK